MELQMQHTNLNNFLQSRQREILAIAQKNTQEIVKTELALADFELLLSVNIPEKEQKKLTAESRKLRTETWNELSERFNGDFNKTCNFLNEL